MENGKSPVSGGNPRIIQSPFTTLNDPQLHTTDGDGAKVSSDKGVAKGSPKDNPAHGG